MLTLVKAFFARKLLRQLTSLATAAIYSEGFEFDAIATRLSRGDQSETALLRAYVAIETAAKLTAPVTDAQIEEAYAEFCLSERVANEHEFGEILATHKELANLRWRLKSFEILIGKLAFKIDEESYAATIYGIERERKGPISKEERAKYEVICGKLAVAKRELEREELKAWKDQDQAEYLRYKEELELRDIREQINSNEHDNLREELAELISMFNAKLRNLRQLTPTS